MDQTLSFNSSAISLFFFSANNSFLYIPSETKHLQTSVFRVHSSLWHTSRNVICTHDSLVWLAEAMYCVQIHYICIYTCIKNDLHCYMLMAKVRHLCTESPLPMPPPFSTQHHSFVSISPH